MLVHRLQAGEARRGGWAGKHQSAFAGKGLEQGRELGSGCGLVQIQSRAAVAEVGFRRGRSVYRPERQLLPRRQQHGLAGHVFVVAAEVGEDDQRSHGGPGAPGRVRLLPAGSRRQTLPVVHGSRLGRRPAPWRTPAAATADAGRRRRKLRPEAGAGAPDAPCAGLWEDRNAPTRHARRRATAHTDTASRWRRATARRSDRRSRRPRLSRSRPARKPSPMARTSADCAQSTSFHACQATAGAWRPAARAAAASARGGAALNASALKGVSRNRLNWPGPIARAIRWGSIRRASWRSKQLDLQFGHGGRRKPRDELRPGRGQSLGARLDRVRARRKCCEPVGRYC